MFDRLPAGGGGAAASTRLFNGGGAGAGAGGRSISVDDQLNRHGFVILDLVD